MLAFMMTLAELYLIKGTSTVTLSVAGISKEVLIIGLSVLLYGDVLTNKTYIGYMKQFYCWYVLIVSLGY